LEMDEFHNGKGVRYPLVSEELAPAVPNSESNGKHTRHSDYTGLGMWCPTPSF
jgi:hypothetical protein